jgi:integrase/recombinase XerD
VLPKSQSVTSSVTFLSVGEVARILGKPRKTVLEWCHSGRLPAKPVTYGKKTTFQIPVSALEMRSQEQDRQEEARQQKEKKHLENHQALIPEWVKAMEKGIMTGKAFSPSTVDYYRYHMKDYFSRHRVLSFELAQQELLKCPVEQYGKRFKYHKALVSYGKYLQMRGYLEASVIEEIKTLRPKAHKPPKRTTVDEGDLQAVLDACQTLQERLIVMLLASTGIRAAECCAIRLEDINLEEGVLDIPLGKGGKTRKLGLPVSLSVLLQEYLSGRESSHPAMALLIDHEKKPLGRYSLYRLLKRIGKRVGVSVHPHALRRAFVTINAGKGRPLVYLQKACGHSDIKTTMSYCRTTEQEVIEAMKGWD